MGLGLCSRIACLPAGLGALQASPWLHSARASCGASRRHWLPWDLGACKPCPDSCSTHLTSLNPSAGFRSTAHRCHASHGSSQSSSNQASSGSSGTLLTLPTMLTIGRVLAIPVLIAAWYTPAPSSSTVVTATFVAASLTDWLDGYLARKMNLSSPFGAFLDPVADKLMVAAVLILLSTRPLAAGPLAGDALLLPLCTLAIIGREITMSALREWAASLGGEARSAVAVSWMGKWKTATQMVSLTLLLLVRDGPVEGWLGVVAGWAGPALLLLATALTVLSLADYTRALWRFLV